MLPFLRICAIVLTTFVGVLGTPASAQISPGPLSRAHQQLEGVGKCATCHALASGPRSFKCLECHGEIRRRIDARTGMHARDYHAAQGQTDCARCHMEHNGLDFALARLDRKAFDHAARTGFALAGKHRAQKCENCHNPGKIATGARTEIKIKNLNRTFLGLGRECLSCHKDQHRGQVGADCTRCHTQDAWKPPSGFNHTSARFQLTGLHQTVACQKCHVPPPGETTGAFKGLSFGGCQNCHADPHKGAFQEVLARAACDTCHNTGGWKNNRPGGSFDHATTKFALAGKHAGVVCSKCHKSTDFHQPIAHARCMDCHKDEHNGQFLTRAAGADCSSCHTENGYKPTRFDRAAHNRSAFPLDGKHVDLPCAKCHQPEGKAAVYKTGKLVCSACHEDKHAKQFASAPYENRCDQCHTTASFKPDNTFSVERHAKTQFPLAGKHATVACRDCHKPLGETRQFHFDSHTCNSCHTDPHQTKLACDTCHTPERWKPAASFDHVSTGFRLEGGHAKVEQCIQCHKAANGTGAAPVPVAAKGAVAAVSNAPVFANTTKRCFECHKDKDPHGGQFRALGRDEDCSACHVTLRWSKEDFDHEKARYTLDIAHRRVACEKCHKTQREIAAKMVRFYRGTPTECIQCH